jgi:hypothetical protein
MIDPFQGHGADIQPALLLGGLYLPPFASLAHQSAAGIRLQLIRSCCSRLSTVEIERIQSFFGFNGGKSGFDVPLQLVAEPRLKIIGETDRAGG